jgi:hypothetical protein
MVRPVRARKVMKVFIVDGLEEAKPCCFFVCEYEDVGVKVLGRMV